MKFILFTLLIFCVLSKETHKVNRSKYFLCEFLTPKKCQIENEEGLKAFIKSEFPNYPMVINQHSDRAAFVFYDILGTKIEEISLIGLKQSQIENILDKRGFYTENPDQFKEYDDKVSDEYILDLMK